MKPSRFDVRSDNCTAIFATFLNLLLPVLQPYVNLRMKNFYMSGGAQTSISGEGPHVDKSAKIKGTKGIISKDSVQILQKKATQKGKKQQSKLQSKPSSHNELAKQYLSPQQSKNFKGFDQCSDVRVFLTIMAGAECFTAEEADLAGKLKESGNVTAHDVDKFTKQYTLDALEALEELLRIIPEDTQNQLRDLQQVKKYGWQAWLQNRSGQEITALRKSLEDICSSIPSLKASIDATLKGEEDKLKDIEVVEKKMKWQKLPELDKIVCTELELVSLRGNSAGLQSIIATNKPKTKSTEMAGYGFKIAKDPFSKGTSRLAYRGHFEDIWTQDSDYFRDSPEVVVKVSSEDASTFQRVHFYAHEFAEEWNTIRGGEEIIFSRIVSVKLPGFEGTQTIEPYLNRKLYRKWYVVIILRSFSKFTFVFRSNNDGFSPVKENYEPIPDAFSHWTYQVSRGQMLVVDLQVDRAPHGVSASESLFGACCLFC